MIKFDTFGSAIDLKRGATADYNDLLLHLLTEMAGKIHQLEARLDSLNRSDTASFDERVLEVLDVRSGSAFEHLEAEIEEKLEGFIETHSFAEAVADAVQGSLHGVVEEILDGILADAITDHLGDAEDIVRKGLRSIL
jgi:hypothetical protein